MSLPKGRRVVRKRVDEVAEVRGGYIAPASMPSDAEASTIRGLLAGDVEPDGDVPWSALRSVSAPRDPKRYEVREGDVVLPLRAVRLFAAVMRGVPENVIAVGSWAVLTPKHGLVTPEFLAWYLNHPTTARRLGQLSQGSSLQFLSLAAIRDFDVELPGIELQDRIARADLLQRRATDLERRLGDVRKQFIDALTIEALRASDVESGSNHPHARGSLADGRD
jgi:hypothetical protein